MDALPSVHSVKYQLRSHRRDRFIEFIKALLAAQFIVYARDNHERDELIRQYEGVLHSVERLVDEHRRGLADRGDGAAPPSELEQLVPQVGVFFTALPLVRALRVYDRWAALSARRFVPPSFNDVRHVLNIAQVLALRQRRDDGGNGGGGARLVSFDGDQTLYEDGGDFTADSALLEPIVTLLRGGSHVALVTAAGYAGRPERYERRLRGLLQKFAEWKLEPHIISRFFVLGGECNFLFRCGADSRLVEVPRAEFATEEMRGWDAAHVAALLDAAERSLAQGLDELRLGASYELSRKAMAVGIVRRASPPPRASTEARAPPPPAAREQLDELVLRARQRVLEARLSVRFCAFNGGRDVWVDVGDKLVGVRALQRHLRCDAADTLHVGDQFLSTGNDYATRRACCTAWVSSPADTELVLTVLAHGQL